MKIALICPSSLPCPPIRSGAIELLVDRIAPHLSRLGGQVVVFSIQDPLLPSVEKINGVDFVRYPKDNYIHDVLSHLNKEYFDLIQVFNNQEWIEPIKRTSPASRLILSLHNLRLGYTTDDVRSIQIIKTVDQLVTVSRFVAQDIIHRYPLAVGKTTVLYTGEDPARYVPHDSQEGKKVKERLRGELGIPNEYPIVLYAGRLVKFKGCHLLIEAMKEVKKQYPRVALVIVGSKWYGEVEITPYIEALIKDAREVGDVYFKHFIPANDMPPYYIMSDIFVCPSQWEEPLARVHYEAMAASLPIITTNRGGNAEVINPGKNGLVIDRYDQPSAFAQAIIQLLQYPLLCEKMGRNNRDLVEKKYNFQQYSQQLFGLYKKIQS